MRSHTWRVAGLLFGSGFCALVYQIGWMREFRLIFGASTAASAAVLAIFIGGLGVGGLLLGGRADRHARPILFYSWLETIVAFSAAATPFVLALVRPIYISLGGTARLGLVVGTLVRLVLSALVLAVPTIAMGGTLPAAARGATRHADARRQDAAALYALNTLGAVTGSLVATFFWLELFGTRMTMWLAAAINLLVAVLARQIDRSPALQQVQRVPSASHHPDSLTPTAPTAFLLVASGVVGFAFFLMELVWYRMLGPLLGGSVFTFGLILGVALAGVGLGGLVYALVSSDRPATLPGFAFTCLLEALAMSVGYALGDRLALLTLVLLPLGRVGFTAQAAGWTVVASLVVLAPALVAGYQFPLLIALFGRGREHLGTEIGRAYATNTLGAIIGSLAGGFGLLPWLSAPGAWRFASLSLVALGLAALALGAARGGRRTLAAQLALVAATIALFLTTGPTAVWRHSGIGAGRAVFSFTAPNQLIDSMNTENRAVAWEGDGIESSVALSRMTAGYSFVVNGKSDGNARGDAGTQVMAGLLGAIVNRDVRSALVVGLGTGSTAGWLGSIPSIARVDVVELEPLILDVARDCRPVNRDVLHNPKVHIRIGDAREVLLTARDQYDVIASEPSNPFRAGIASLFTREYYLAARDRLTSNGVFVQWMQAYEIDSRTLRTVFATLASVFPHVEAWQTTPGDLMLIGATRPLSYQADALSKRIQEEPFKTAMNVAWRAIDMNGLLAHFVASDQVLRTLASDPGVDLNTDDRNVIEFGLARSMGRGGSLHAELRDVARAAGGGRPTIDQAAIDWSAVETEWIGYQAVEQHVGALTSGGPPAERARQAALILYYRDQNFAAARIDWQQQSKAPSGPTELAMVADIEAESGSDAALPLIDALRAYEPAEADTILATLRLRQSRDGEAAALLEAALQAFREDPWPIVTLKVKAVRLAAELGRRSPLYAPRMLAAMKEPFAVGAAQDERLIASAFLTRLVDFKGTCQAPFRALEPHVPWRGDFLALRRECYQVAGDPRLAAAESDFRDFLSREPRPLAMQARR